MLQPVGQRRVPSVDDERGRDGIMTLPLKLPHRHLQIAYISMGYGEKQQLSPMRMGFRVQSVIEEAGIMTTV
jgi:hypothetical protein